VLWTGTPCSALPSSVNDSEIATECEGVAKIKLDIDEARFKNDLDYVARRFNASSAGLKKPVGLILRWNTA
jgi:hypothetical protein